MQIAVADMWEQQGIAKIPFRYLPDNNMILNYIHAYQLQANAGVYEIDDLHFAVFKETRKFFRSFSRDGKPFPGRS